jgi:ABC-type phosphate transport system substrate-binding protein
VITRSTARAKCAILAFSMSLERLTRHGLFLLAVVLALSSAGSAATSGEPQYWIVVHPDNRSSTLRREEVSRLFLKKITRWSDGRTAAPVDLVASAPVRDAFSRDIHRRPPSAIKKYWQQMVFSGQSAPPPEVATEADVLAIVRSDPAAIGYVSDEVVLQGVKILDIVEPSPRPASGPSASKGR